MAWVKFRVTKLGSGTCEDPFRPDVPSGVHFIVLATEDTTMVIAVPEEQAVRVSGENLGTIERLNLPEGP